MKEMKPLILSPPSPPPILWDIHGGIPGIIPITLFKGPSFKTLYRDSENEKMQGGVT